MLVGNLLLAPRTHHTDLDDWLDEFVELGPQGWPQVYTHLASLAAVALCTFLLDGLPSSAWWQRLRGRGRGGAAAAAGSGRSPAHDGKIGFSYSCLFGDRQSVMSAASTRLARVLASSDDAPVHMTDERRGRRAGHGDSEGASPATPDSDDGGDDGGDDGDDRMETEGALEGFCVDCKEQEAAVRCSECCDDYCRVCFEMLHRRGARAGHTAVVLRAATKASEQDAHMPVDVMLSQPDAGAEAEAGWWFEERTKYIPMRLTMEERKYLRLLEAALQVSGYTDKVDGSAALAKGGAKRTQAQVREVCGFLTALVCGFLTALVLLESGARGVRLLDSAGGGVRLPRRQAARRHAQLQGARRLFPTGAGNWEAT